MAYPQDKQTIFNTLAKNPKLKPRYLKHLIDPSINERTLRGWMREFEKVSSPGYGSDKTPVVAGTETVMTRDSSNPTWRPIEVPKINHRTTGFSQVVEDTEIKDFESKSETNQYESPKVLSARKDDGTIMNLQEYCERYGLDYSQAKSYKLITHTGTPYYNFASHTINGDEVQLSVEEIKELLRDDFASIRIKKNTAFKKRKISVIKIADIHCGAFVNNLLKTKDYSLEILAGKLARMAEMINEENSSEVHIHILGDLIESFTGLNHKNSWRGVEQGMVGAEVIKTTTRILHEYLLSRITNLATVKIIAGNHDRTTSDKSEDVNGDAANLISWGLELAGYDVEFNPYVITHVVDGISHVLLHGHEGVSKKTTKEICWDYGTPKMYNLICEGHLHSIIEKLSVSQRKNFQTIKDDAIDHRRMHCPSLFTGNIYSERLGYTSNSGFVVTRNNGQGVPHVFYYAV